MAPAYSDAKLEMGRQVKAARLARKLSIDAAAARIGTSRQQWIRWEKAQNMPTDYAAALGELLGLSADVFVEEDASDGVPFRGVVGRVAGDVGAGRGGRVGKARGVKAA